MRASRYGQAVFVASVALCLNGACTKRTPIAPVASPVGAPEPLPPAAPTISPSAQSAPTLLAYGPAPELFRLDIAGEVSLLVTVAADGSVSDARVVRGINGISNDLFLSWVRQWRFRPGLVNGSPAVVTVPASIKLEAQPRHGWHVTVNGTAA
jgi:TonB family protein